MPTIPTASRNAMCNALVDLIDAGSGEGTLVFHTSAHAEVATLTFSDPAFGASDTGVATASAITSDTDATGGVIDHAHILDSDATVITDLTCGIAATDVIFGSTASLTLGATDTLGASAFTVTVPAS